MYLRPTVLTQAVHFLELGKVRLYADAVPLPRWRWRVISRVNWHVRQLSFGVLLDFAAADCESATDKQGYVMHLSVPRITQSPLALPLESSICTAGALGSGTAGAKCSIRLQLPSVG